MRLWAILFLVCFSHAAFADMKNDLVRMFPYQKIIQIKKTPYAGLYEVDFEDRLIYVDEKLNFMIDGNIIDLRTLKNVTEERKKDLYAIKFDQLPLKLAIRKGQGEKRLAVFSDPRCTYCRRLEKELQGLTGASVYIFPVSFLPGSEELNRSIWCAPDRLKSWEAHMLKGSKPVGAGKCDSSDLDKIMVLADELGIRSTPTLVFQDGSKNEGLLPLAAIRERIGRQ